MILRFRPQLVSAVCCCLGLWLVSRRVIALMLSAADSSTAQAFIFPNAQKLPGWSQRPLSKAVVLGKLSEEDTAWTAELEPNWDVYKYTVDNATALRHTAQNKGREANAYLTYLVEHYHDLSDIMVFVHSHRNGYPAAWHTEGSNHDIVDALQRLNTSYVETEGFANLRCNHDPGCSTSGRIQPYRHVNDTQPLDRDAAAEVAWLSAWPKLFPDAPIPKEIAAPCCAQFAVSRKQVRSRPLADYKRFHTWLMETKFSDDISGRVMEYAWHIIFGQDVKHCPEYTQCLDSLYTQPSNTVHRPLPASLANAAARHMSDDMSGQTRFS